MTSMVAQSDRKALLEREVSRLKSQLLIAESEIVSCSFLSVFVFLSQHKNQLESNRNFGKSFQKFDRASGKSER
jgi:hypothetical protein